MSAQEIDKEAVQPQVVLVVPKQHVKTVKSALERFDQFDRSSRITLEPQAEAEIAVRTGTASEQDRALRSHSREDMNTAIPMVSGATHQQGSSAYQRRFPVLKFDVASGEYVDPSMLEDSTRAHGVDQNQKLPPPPASSGVSNIYNPFRALHYDADSGQYVDALTSIRRDQNHEIVEERGSTSTPAVPSQDRSTATAFPRLHFDPASGEYVGDSGQPEEMPGEYETASERLSGDTQSDTAFPRLHFDVASGEYVDQSDQEKGDRSPGKLAQQRMRIPTTIPYRSKIQTSGIADDEGAHELKAELLDNLALDHLSKVISISYRVPSVESDGSPVSKSPVHIALKKALNALPVSTLASLKLTPEILVASFPDGYSVYKPMLLLPHNAFSSAVWKTLLATHTTNSDLLQPVCRRIAESVGATHVAINSPIPSQSVTLLTEAVRKENILRSPSNLTPLYGDFGPEPSDQTLSSPTPSDYDAALWVTTKQNGIHQTWAPRYTMFSRGNIREKTRILHHPTVARDFDVPSAAADLYAGIGYFAFSYRKSAEGRQNGIKRVICWEINPWSVEGLRRGAELNGWTCRIIKPENARRLLRSSDGKPLRYDEDFIVFQMNNEDADSTYAAMKDSLLKLPVRHVNLGLLPHSKLSWKSAVRILDTERGGWIHAHENVGINDIEERIKEVEREFQGLLDEWDERLDRRKDKRARKVRAEHVERVKMYAPGVMHCVFDIAIKEA
jgi:tRNA wybutosine-synthesizing protein 2